MMKPRHDSRKPAPDVPAPAPEQATPAFSRARTSAVVVPLRPPPDGPPGTRRQRILAARLAALRWAGTRLAFYAYVGFSLLTVAGGFVTAPLMTWLFYNDWRFWRYWRRAWRLFPHGWHIAWQMLGRKSRFMLSVPLTSPPRTGADHDLIELAPDWQHGTSCGDCQRCCQVLNLRCPVLDESTGFCTGYNSFYWRYFNCGRYPTRPLEISFYGCRKWRMK